MASLFVSRIDVAATERRPRRFSRGTLLKASVAGLGALAGGAVGATELVASPDAHGSAATDKEILTFGLLMERLQAAFYADALRTGHLTGEARQFAQVVGGHEQDHVKFLESALGSAAGKTPNSSSAMLSPIRPSSSAWPSPWRRQAWACTTGRR